jgi:DNA-binding response OmpR family regulator
LRHRAIAVGFGAGGSDCGQRGDRIRGNGAGFDHYLVKPVDIEVFRKILGS